MRQLLRNDSRQSWSGEMSYIKQDGSQLWCKCTVSRFTHVTHGRVLLFICQDIEEELRMREDLKKAKDRADRENHMKTSFLATVSHEIR